MKTILLCGLVLISSTLNYAQATTTTTITTTTTTTTKDGVTETSNSPIATEKGPTASTQKSASTFRLSILGGPAFPNNFETSYEIKPQGNYKQQNNWPIDLASIPDNNNMSFGYGLELYIPANNWFGFSIGYKALSEIKGDDIEVSFLGQSSSGSLENGTYIASQLSLLYANLQLNLSEAFHFYGGVNMSSGTLKMASDQLSQSVSMDLEGAMGFQIGAGFNITDNLALYIQYDQLQFSPDENNNFIKTLLESSFSQVGLSPTLELAENYSTSVVQAGVRLDLVF